MSDAQVDASTAAYLFIRQLAESVRNAETVGDLFDAIEAIEDQCEQLRAIYRAEDAEPPRAAAPPEGGEG